MNKQKRTIYFKSILTIIPASILGIIGMIYNEVPNIIWLQNLVTMLFCAIMAFVLVFKKVKINDMMIAVISLILLLLTLFGNGMDGVHRWIRLAIINVNVAMIVLPIILVVTYNLLEKKKVRYALTVIITGAILLFLQPDASQLIGFSIPMIIFMFYKKINSMVRYLVSAMLICLMILSWLFIDKLAPVSYVEGILGLLNNISLLWLIIGIISLILVPLPYILFPPAKFRLLSICIGLYYCLITISTIFGNFPVPFMGYGISPIIGYWIVFIWYVKKKSGGL